MHSKLSVDATKQKGHACKACTCNQEPATSTGDVTHLRIHSLTHDGSLADHNPDASQRVLGPTKSALAAAKRSTAGSEFACGFRTVISRLRASGRSHRLGRARCAGCMPSSATCGFSVNQTLAQVLFQSALHSTMAHVNMQSASMHLCLDRTPVTPQTSRHVVLAPQRRRCHMVRMIASRCQRRFRVQTAYFARP